MIIPVPIIVSRRCAKQFLRSVRKVLFKKFPRASREIILMSRVRKYMEIIGEILALNAPVKHDSEESYFYMDDPKAKFSLAIEYWVQKIKKDGKIKFLHGLRYQLITENKTWERKAKQQLRNLAHEFHAELERVYCG